MKKSRKLVFFGTEDFSSHALEALIAAGWIISAVVTKPDARSGRGKNLTMPRVKEVALRESIEVLQPQHFNEAVINKIKNYGCDVGVLSAYGKIIPREVLEIFDVGIVNIHPSLLPKYRGASPIEQAILRGDKETGVSLIKLVPKMDAGPIYAQKKVALSGRETAPELYELLGKLGSKLLVDKLDSIIDGQLTPTEQNDALATYAPMLKKSDGLVDWNKKAMEIDRQIRAYLRWPGSTAQLSGAQIIITKARLGSKSDCRAGNIFSQNGEIEICCADGSIIIERLKPAGKREMTSQEFLAGHKI